MTGDEKVKKSRDPIFTACFVIFVVAAVAILAGFINDHYIQEDNTEAAYGDKVTVNYTGSYYGFVGDDVAVVFDTSYSSIGNNDKIVKANSFTKTSYSSLDFTIGNGTMIKAFEESVVGHKVGDKYTIMIPAGEGYTGPASVTESMNDRTEQVTATMPKTAFKNLYSDVSLVEGVAVQFKAVYGWDALATLAGNDVIILNMPKAGETYDYIGNEDSEFGDVRFQVTSVGDEIRFNYVIDNEKSTGVNNGEIQMIEIDFGTEKWYITNVLGDEFTYKTEEKSNIALYFEIEVVSIN